MAGIAAAYNDNGKGIAGVAPDAELVVAKVLTATATATATATGTGASDDVTAGIKWVVDHGARVFNPRSETRPGHHLADPAQ